MVSASAANRNLCTHAEVKYAPTLICIEWPLKRVAHLSIYLLIYLLTLHGVLFYYAEINGAQSAIQNARLNLLLLYCVLRPEREISARPYAKTPLSLFCTIVAHKAFRVALAL